MKSVYYYAQAAYDKLVHRRSEPAVTEATSQKIARLARRKLGKNIPSESNFEFLNDDGDSAMDSEILSPMEQLPEEILDVIFDKLDVDTLKTCRLVSFQWNSILSTSEPFRDKLCHCHVESEQTDETRTELSKYFKHSGGIPPLDLTSLRLRHLFSFWTPIRPEFYSWMNSRNMINVTWLEIQNSQMKISQLVEIVAELMSLKTLKITGETIIHNSLMTYPLTDALPVPNIVKMSGIRQFQNLKHLTLHFEDMHNFLNLLDRLELLVFRNLETLDLQGDSGNTTHKFQLGGVLEKLFIQNSKSLRVFRLDNFPDRVGGALDTRLSSSKYELRSSLYAEFPRFVSTFPWKELPKLTELREISFQRFPVAHVTDSFILENLVPFFRECSTKLKKFSIGQLYLSKDTDFEKMAAIVPRGVHFSVTSVHLYAPNPNLDDLTEVMHCEQNILIYRRSAVNLGFDNGDWTINYLTWPSLAENPVMPKWSHLLKSLTLTYAMFKIGDKELQFLIQEAKGLEELSFEATDLAGLTDSGITGLSHNAINKIWADEKYQPIGKDYTGEPIQNLKKLRKLRLLWVGTEVTHVSILRSFLLMPQLTNFDLYQNTLVIRPCAIEKLRERGNIFFRYLPVNNQT